MLNTSHCTVFVRNRLTEDGTLKGGRYFFRPFFVVCVIRLKVLIFSLCINKVYLKIFYRESQISGVERVANPFPKKIKNVLW